MCCCRPAIQCSFPAPCPATPHTMYLHNTVGLIHMKKNMEGAHRRLLACHWKTKLVPQLQATGSQRRPMSLHYHSRNPPEISTLAGSVFFTLCSRKLWSEREREKRERREVRAVWWLGSEGLAQRQSGCRHCHQPRWSDCLLCSPYKSVVVVFERILCTFVWGRKTTHECPDALRWQ